MKTMFFAMYFLTTDGIPQIETQIFDSHTECVAYMGKISKELKFWKEHGGRTNGSQKMPWIDWRMTCSGLDPKWNGGW